MTPGGLVHARYRPVACAEWLSNMLSADAMAVTVAHHDAAMTIFDIRIDAPPPTHLPGYPAEHVRINIRPAGEIWAVPIGPDDRAWCHRYPYLTLRQFLRQTHEPFTWNGITGPLCTEYPLDPPHLRWQWANGLHTYLRIVQRHLWSEEYWRRHGTWPVEDAPHGDPAVGTVHPIRTCELRSA